MRGCHCKVPVYCTVSIHLHRVKLSGTEAERPTLERGATTTDVIVSNMSKSLVEPGETKKRKSASPNTKCPETMMRLIKRSKTSIALIISRIS
jgi:hypothetical protein